MSAPEALLWVTYIGAGWQSHVKSRTPGVLSVFIVVVVLCYEDECHVLPQQTANCANGCFGSNCRAQWEREVTGVSPESRRREPLPVEPPGPSGDAWPSSRRVLQPLGTWGSRLVRERKQCFKGQPQKSELPGALHSRAPDVSQPPSRKVLGRGALFDLRRILSSLISFKTTFFP